ncbi:MAG TPA: glycoside hydrolase family 3 protein [Steroidobacteraceae bacterium]|jgi:beta-glucosidase|nr:glycoside hydrolase family 3 protein [Steroidobacteraceae bacterium]
MKVAVARSALGLAFLALVAAAGATPAVHPELWPRAAPALPADPRLEARIAQLLAHMTPAQKVGQLIQADIGSITPDDLEQYPLGSVLNGANVGPHDDKLASPREWLALADRFYAASTARGAAGVVPLLWGTDAVHGHNNVQGATIFPHNIGLGAARDPALLRRIGEITALEVRVTGLDWAFAPTVAVVRDARWGRTYESYGESPQLVAGYATAMVQGLQGRPGTPQFLDAAHVLATAKHFLGDGGTGGHDEGDNPASEAQLRDVDAAGHVAAIAAGVQTVMASFSSWQGVKMHGNRALLTDVLRGRMGFDGLLIGDWNGHEQLPGCSAASCPAAINAGLDVLMAPSEWRQLFANMLTQVSAGEIPSARLDEAVGRVLRVKLRAHLDTEGPPSGRQFAGHFELLGSAAHRAVARQAVRESLVLLKNRRQLLPLAPQLHVLVAGAAADDVTQQCGGWTIDWQGTMPGADIRPAESIYAGIRRAVSAAGGSAELSRTGDFRLRPDVAIVVFGEQPYAEGRGDVASLVYGGDELALIRRLKAAGIAVVAVLISGRPLWIDAELQAADSFVVAWLPGAEGGGVADVLFRSRDGSVRHDFRGRLPLAWPRSPEPAGTDSGTPLFPFGYGLKYR